MTSFADLADRVDALRAEIVLERVDHPLGGVLSLAVRIGDRYLGRWPAPAGDVQCAARWLLSPYATEAPDGALRSLTAECAARGLNLGLADAFVDVSLRSGAPLLRHPSGADDPLRAAHEARRYLAACGWEDGVVLRHCPACGVVRRLADFRAAETTDGVLFALCQRHHGHGRVRVTEAVFLGR